MPLNFIHLHLLFPLQLCHPQKHLQVIVITLTLILCYTYFPSKSPNPNPGRPLLIFIMLIVLHLCQLPDPEPLHLKRVRKNALVRALSRLSESSLVNYDDLFPVCLFNFTPTHGHSRPHHRCLRSLRSTNYRSLSLIANVVYLVLVLWVESWPQKNPCPLEQRR